MTEMRPQKTTKSKGNLRIKWLIMRNCTKCRYDFLAFSCCTFNMLKLRFNKLAVDRYNYKDVPAYLLIIEPDKVIQHML